MTTFEAAVIGAGPAGLAAALALAHSGIQTALVGPVVGAGAGGRPAAPSPVEETGRPREGSASLALDRRTTALIGPSVQLLANLDAWEACAAHAAPIAAVRMADDRGGLIRAPEMLFRAAEIGLDSFGANLANPALLAALNGAAERAARLVRIETAAVTRIEPGAAAVRLGLAEGGSVAATLAVAADGRASSAPAAAGIGVRGWDYPQAAVVASFGHSRPHAATVNELHRHKGPLTTVPLPGRRSALVWVEAPQEARRLAALGERQFAAELEERLQGVLGTIGAVEPRAVHALSGRRTERVAGRRIALVGEAAHVVPPIGAQGLNMGLRDAAALADCAAAARARGEDIGGAAALAAYEGARSGDVLARSLSIDLLNRSLLADLLPVEALRGLGVHAVASLPVLRQLLMKEGAGLGGALPTLMRKA
jgi:2-octaprenyl-6-methoxyphenol hydroxylase